MTTPEEIFICPSAALQEGGLGKRFPVQVHGDETTGFVVRYGGMVYGYLNRCAHVPIELDWAEGEFFESSGLYLMCATHGAVYAPDTGKCAGGPCTGAHLRKIMAVERDGQVFWRPDDIVQPVEAWASRKKPVQRDGAAQSEPMSNNESDNPQDRPPQSSSSSPASPPPAAPSSSIPASVREDKKSGWERDVLEKLALFAVKEQRARRRWGIFFRIAILVVIVLGGWMAFTYNKIESEPLGTHTALVEIRGTIESEGQGSAGVVIPALDKAFAASDSVGVILKINSPGGSPVQAGMINDEITRLRKAYPKKPIYVVVEEMCASGGYYIAVAADKIYVNKASLIGSVGVLMDGFGFTGLMDKLGVERRLLTAGENKSFLDPFSPQSPKQREYAQSMLQEIHQQFIEVVRQGRGTRLKETPDTFSGLVWTGSKAVELGLADGYGTVDSVARDVIKAEDVVDYTQTENLSERVLKKFGVAFGAGFAKTLMSAPLSQLR